MDEDRFGSVAAFVAVARRLNFAAAARALGVNGATVSRRIRRLEEQVGARLLTRTTRRVALTEAGIAYLERCESVLAALEEADLTVAMLNDARPRGLLRVSLPVAFGRLHVAPLLPAFLERYPDLKLDVGLSDAMVDLVHHQIDVAVRIADLADSGLIARRLAPNRRLLCAAPAYLARHGTPAAPADLERHECLHYTPHSAVDVWHLTHADGTTAAVPVAGRLRADSGETIYLAALAGHGIVLTPEFLAHEALARGALVPVLDDWAPAPSAIYAIQPTRRLIPPKARVFVDFLAEQFAGTPAWARWRSR
ncbi:LysR family transcriptional regulator [Aliidongia dinghuensis]|uniref:LysR family transcriptional regulator n=1 Tax=Aliidongia dinghuensis TaxID=1867774 RepID=A0A8J3E596_9PROT|nr:LysR family transcriptional regulator [Aliidongia dinghuensis]GGF45562.1 LysR family transcriptional regulator [Aliidongia dinghuensis]